MLIFYKRVLCFSILQAILFICPQASLLSQDLTTQADDLVKKAEALGRTGEVVVIGDKGLVIEGTSLTGAEVQRPATMLARAAELYADAAVQSQDMPTLLKALKIWDSIDDRSTPVGYLRVLSKKAKYSNVEAAVFADVELAKCYLQQGDTNSAVKIFSTYAGAEPKGEAIGQAKAYYAQFLLGQGKFEEAQKLAEEVKSKIPHVQMSYYGIDSYDVAVSVLAMVPSQSKQGTVSGSAKESELLADVQSNPRRYYALGEVALAAGNKSKAIEYWLEYAKRYPQDELSQRAFLLIGKLYYEMGNISGALDTYKQAWTIYPDFQAGWESRISASKIKEKNGEIPIALQILDEGIDKTQSMAGKAWLIARQAEIHAKNKDADRAVERYILLLSKYGDQDASRNAYKQLSGLTNQTKDWRKISNQIRDWLSGGSQKSGNIGSTSLTMGARSELRRLGLNFFIEQGELQSGISWLKSIGYSSDSIERDWIVRDEAWLYAGIAKEVVKKGKRVPPKDFAEGIQLGIKAWQLAPATEEGLNGLRAAYDLSTSPIAKKNQIKDVIALLETLKGTEYDDTAKDMLTNLYKITGDKKGLEELNN